ncbi:MAG: class I SAM-dependent methyltransferase [Planctomycetota bacterium]
MREKLPPKLRARLRMARDLIKGTLPGPRAIPLPRDRFAHFPRLERRADHPTSWNFPASLDRSVPWINSLAKLYELPISFPASMSPECGLLLHGLVRNARPKRVLEIGTFCSVSTHWIAGALQANNVEPDEAGRLHCFDDFGPVPKGPWRDAEMPEGRLEFVSQRLTSAGLLELCRFHPGASAEQIPRAHEALRAAGGIDFALIDGDHTTPGVIADLLAVEPILNTGGVVVFHDIYPEECGGHTGPRDVVDRVWRPGTRRHRVRTVGSGIYEPVEIPLAPLNYGLAVLRRVG